jgi:hypothetical protein
LTREKIPVFPIDWLVTENIINIQQVRLEPETKLKLRDAFARILKEERRARAFLEKYLGPEKMGEAPEDAHQCFYCTDFAFLSLVYCKTHKFNYCIYHELQCKCPSTQLRLLYRYTNEELAAMEASIALACSGRIKKKIFTSQ